MARYKGTMEDACRIGDLQTVIKLVTKDRKLAKQADEIGITPLHRACANNHMAIVELLLEVEADVNAIDKYGDAPLKKAAYSGHSDIVNVLVNHGADVNYKDQNDKLALHHSAEQGQLQSVEAVIDHGSEVNSFSKDGQTPLHLAAQNGHSWCCKALLVAKAYIDARGGQFMGTALHMAAEGGHTHTVQLLIAEMADLNIQDKQSRLPYLLARRPETKEAFQNPFAKLMVHANSCTAEGPGINPKPRADDSCMFIIQPRDRYGVPIRDDHGFLEFTVDVHDPSGTIVPASVIPNPRIGSSVCYFDGSHSGVHYIHAYMQGYRDEGDMGSGRRVPIAGSPFRIDIQPAPLDPYNTRAFGRGVGGAEEVLVVSELVKLRVSARDRFQNPTSNGEISVRISPNNEEPLALKITQLKIGEFEISYISPPIAGTYLLTVAVQHDKHVYNSPFTVPVQPAPPSPARSIVGGRGLSVAGVGLPARFWVESRDEQGNRGGKGHVSVEAEVYYQEEFPARVHDTGRMPDEVVPELPPSSLPTTPMSGGSRRERRRSSVTQHSPAPGQSTPKQVSASPMAGRALFGSPQGSFTRKAAEKEAKRQRMHVRIADLGNGSWVGEWTPFAAGSYSIRILVNSVETHGSPFTVFAHELPEWDAEEVALFIESICNFPEYSRNFLINGVVGYSLCGLTVERIQKELNVVSSSHARNIVYAIRQYSLKAVDPSGLALFDDHTLQQLGILDLKARQRILFAVEKTSERTTAASEREELYRQRLKNTLQQTGEGMQDEMRAMVETLMADGTDEFIKDFKDGKMSDKNAITERLSNFEKIIKTRVERVLRESTILDFSDVGRAKLPDNSGKAQRRRPKPVSCGWGVTGEAEASGAQATRKTGPMTKAEIEQERMDREAAQVAAALGNETPSKGPSWRASALHDQLDVSESNLLALRSPGGSFSGGSPRADGNEEASAADVFNTEEGQKRASLIDFD